jgi:hypothetical protein
MFALTNRPFRNAGLALYGLGSLASLGLVSNQASAQTLPAASVARAETCEHFLKDRSPKGIEGYVDCEINGMRQRTAQNQRDAAAIRANAQRETTCQDVLIKGIEVGKILPAKVNAIYGGRPIGSISACAVLEQLAKS